MNATTLSALDSQPVACILPDTTQRKPISGLSAKKRNNSPRATPGIPPNERQPVCVVDDAIDRHALYRETVSWLERLEGMVREGRDIEYAHGFSTYVLNARIPHLLSKYPADGSLKVDGAFLDWRVRELKRAVQSQYTGAEAPGVPESELASINHKLNLIAGELVKLTILHKQNE